MCSRRDAKEFDEVMVFFWFLFTAVGLVQETLNWRWIQWIAMCISGAFTVWEIAYGAQETRGSILLMRRAKRLRKETGDPRYRVGFDSPNVKQLVWISCTRPIRMAFIARYNALLSLRTSGFCHI